jgi:hypothetical protein
MGRYYNGDIKGKFWFDVQDSDDASFFGGEKSEPKSIHYYFDKNDLPSIEQGIKSCLKILGENKAKLDQFFNLNKVYDDEMLIQAGFEEDEIDKFLEWYARLELGEKILKCVKEQGACSFEAEL